MNESQIVKSLDQLIVKDEANGVVRELEVDEVFIKCGRIRDDGKIPTMPLRDGAFSRKSMVSYVQEQLVTAFENQQTLNEKNKPYRIWIGEESPLDPGQVNLSLEAAGLHTGDKVYIEFMLESREWPSARELIDKN